MEDYGTIVIVTMKCNTFQLLIQGKHKEFYSYKSNK